MELETLATTGGIGSQDQENEPGRFPATVALSVDQSRKSRDQATPQFATFRERSVRELDIDRIQPAKLVVPSKLPSKKPAVSKPSGSVSKSASASSNVGATGKKTQPRQSTLQFQPRQSTLQFQPSAVKPVNESTSGSTSSNFYARDQKHSLLSKSQHLFTGMIDEFECTDVNKLEPKLYIKEMTPLNRSGSLNGQSFFQILVVYQYLSSFGSVYLNLKEDSAITCLDDLTKLLNDPSSHFKHFLALYSAFVCKLQDVKRIATVNVQRQLVSYLNSLKDESDEATVLARNLDGIDFPLISKEVHLSTLLFLIDMCLPNMRDSLPEVKEELKRLENDRLALLLDRDTATVDVLKRTSTISEDPHDSQSLQELLDHQTTLDKFIRTATESIDALTIYFDDFASKPIFVVDNFLGVDREGRAYWWIKNTASSLASFGIIIEEGYSAVDTDHCDPTQSLNLYAIRSKVELESFLSSLLRNGKREKSLSAAIKTKLKKYDDDDICTALSRFDCWLDQLFSKSSSSGTDGPYNAYFYTLAKDHVFDLGFVCGMKKSLLTTELGDEILPFQEMKAAIMNMQQQGHLHLLTDKQILALVELSHYSDLVKWTVQCSRDAAREVEHATILQELKEKAESKKDLGDGDILGKRRAAAVASSRVSLLHQRLPPTSKSLRIKKGSSRKSSLRSVIRDQSTTKLRASRSRSDVVDSSSSGEELEGSVEEEEESSSDSDDSSELPSTSRQSRRLRKSKPAPSKNRRTSLRNLSKKSYVETDTEHSSDEDSRSEVESSEESLQQSDVSSGDNDVDMQPSHSEEEDS